MTDQFGGIPVESEAPQLDQFGGVSLEDQLSAINSTGPAAVPASPVKPLRFQERSEPMTLEGLAGNIKPSGNAYREQIMSLTKNPRKTAEAMAILFSKEGLIALKDYYVDSYFTSLSDFKRTAYQDPVGFLSDVSVVASVPRLLGKLIPGATGNALKNVGTVLEHADPTMALSTGAKFAAGSALTDGAKVPQGIYRSTLKPSTAQTNKFSDDRVRGTVVEALLDNEIPLNYQGVEKLSGVVGEKTAELDRMIEAATASGKTIPIKDVLSRVNELRGSLRNPATNPTANKDVAKINDFVGDWLRDLGPVREITPAQARELRKNIDSGLNWNLVPSKEEGLATRIDEMLAHGARESLANTAGSAGKAREVSDLLDARIPLKNAAARLDNNNAIGLRETVMLGGAAATPDVPELAALVAAAALFNKESQERLARAIYNSSKLDRAAKKNLLRQLTIQVGARQPSVVEDQMERAGEAQQ